MNDEEPEELSPELEKRIIQQLDEGVTFTVDFESRDAKVLEIHWNPGKRNALAEEIINHVGPEEMPLTHEGHKFMIRRIDGR